MSAIPAPVATRAVQFRAVAAGLAATLLGVGFARFAYPPLIPALIEAGWFDAAEAASLGAANLAGYAVGAFAAAHVADRFGARPVLAAMMAVVAVSFLACAWPAAFAWFLGWRFASGAAGGALMALAAPTVLAIIPVSRRGRGSGLVFTGVGLGIVASGAAAPVAGAFGPRAAWLALAACSAVLFLAATPFFPSAPPQARTPAARSEARLLPLCAAYACDAVGFVPHSVFLADYVARGLGQGLGAGAIYWTLFGAGAVAGPVLVGLAADRFGFARSLYVAFLVKAAAVALPLAFTAWLPLAASSLVVGALTTGIVALSSGRAGEVVGAERRAQAWGTMTAAFALAQAGAAAAMSWLFAVTGAHAPLFAVGALALLLGAAFARPASSR